MLKKPLVMGLHFALVSTALAEVSMDDPLQMDDRGYYGDGAIYPDAPKTGGSAVLKFDDPTVYFGYGVKPGDESWDLSEMNRYDEYWQVKLHTEAFRNPGERWPDAYVGLWFIPKGRNLDSAKAMGFLPSERLHIVAWASYMAKIQVRLLVQGDGPSDGPPTAMLIGGGIGGLKSYSWTNFKRANWGGKTTFDSTDWAKVSAIGFVKIVGGTEFGTVFPESGKADIGLALAGIRVNQCATYVSNIVRDSSNLNLEIMPTGSLRFPPNCITSVREQNQPRIVLQSERHLLLDGSLGVELFDLAGRKLMEIKPTKQGFHDVDLSEQNPGSYFLRTEKNGQFQVVPVELW